MDAMAMVKVVDFFCVCGGASSGFRKAGMDIVAAIDNDPDAVKTFSRNFPEAKVFCEDIAVLPLDSIAEAVSGEGKLLFAGCAPCQPFSKQNRQKKKDDPRLNLLDDFTRFVKYYKPDFIFIENVPGLQKLPVQDSPLNRFVETLASCGYPNPSVKVISTLQYGVPQDRHRLILIVSKRESIIFPEKTHGDEPGLKRYATVRELIGDLPKLEAGKTDPKDPIHFAAKLSPLNLKRIEATPEGGGWEDWCDELLLDCHKRMKANNMAGHSDTYGRLAFDKPSCSLTTRCISYSNGRFGHPVQNRALSVREAACLQTFPRNFTFDRPYTTAARQIGNAVPPLLTEVFGRHFLNHCG